MKLPKLKYNSDGLIPAIATDSLSGEVLMLAYMNEASLKQTLKTGRVTYFSRSRQELWEKGATSGNTQNLISIKFDCDKDTLLLKVKQSGPACHTGKDTCFFEEITFENPNTTQKEIPTAEIITELYKIIKGRKGQDPKSSYVASLLLKGHEKISEKISEEAGELIESAAEHGKKEITHELSDLWFHTLVLLAEKDIPVEDIYVEFKRRFGTSGHIEKAQRVKK
ncbi:MAG: bifunctional phosphoribosyl-AMP cyclohydrolase/phosphoribosyl-ATP diphosphatase HisIE [Deltaproteobacteria bacterium]|nr:bifunctional phosphoribosyl-AMP cyclohydrolase/phosphoribosyl-ATP diphosphatase HisIE [Deltaproteobacteria bacterium]